MMIRLMVVLICLFCLVTCRPRDILYKHYKYNLYIDYKYVSYTGKDSSNTYTFLIDTVYGMRYNGRMIINKTDTLKVHGFYKGHYPTFYQHKNQGEMFFINPFGQRNVICDSVSVYQHGNTSFFKNEVVLFRTKRCEY